jgi:hypothetical protein
VNFNDPSRLRTPWDSFQSALYKPTSTQSPGLG